MLGYDELKALSDRTSTATVSDVMNSGAYQPDIRGLQNITPDRRVFGQAVTVRSLPARPDFIERTKAEFGEKTPGGDPLMYAIKQCGPGKVLVIDAGGDVNAAVGGDTKLAALDGRGAEGLITDGALRDRREFTDQFKFATHCAGFTSLVGTLRVLFPRDVNVDINVGGALVSPGDYIFGDEDGIIVIPVAMIEKALNDGVAYEQQAVYVRDKSVAEGSTYGDVVAKAEEWMPDFLSKADLNEVQKTFFSK